MQDPDFDRETFIDAAVTAVFLIVLLLACLTIYDNLLVSGAL